MTASPVPAAVRPLRRAAVMVADLERSLALYRDVLGLQVWKQGSVDAGNVTFFRLLGIAPATARFVILQAEGSEIGMVGLFEVCDPQPPPLDRESGPGIHRGEVALVFQAPGIAGIHERVVALGLPVVCAPARFAIPGGGVGLEMTFRDFDGALLNLIESGRTG